MLKKDIEILDEFINDQSIWSHKREALGRIKKELVESSKTLTNKQSLKCSQCNSVVENVFCSKCEDEFQQMRSSL